MQQLLRIPGIGTLSAMRIIRQRKICSVAFDDLKKMGVVVKRARYFITCRGRYYGDCDIDPLGIKNALLGTENGIQLSMFDPKDVRAELGEGTAVITERSRF